MMEKQNETLKTLEVTRQLIETLRGTIESLQLNLSQERDDNEGLALTVEALQADNEKLQEKIFQMESLLQEEKESQAEAGENQETLRGLEKKLGFYYQDVKKMNPKQLNVEDGETLYNILDYTFKALKKAGLKLLPFAAMPYKEAWRFLNA